MTANQRHPAFVEAAMKEIAQGRYAKNESIAFADLPEFLMEEAEWAWRAGWEAAMRQESPPEVKQ